MKNHTLDTVGNWKSQHFVQSEANKTNVVLLGNKDENFIKRCPEQMSQHSLHTTNLHPTTHLRTASATPPKRSQ